MEATVENSTVIVKGPQIENSWIPSTPAKPGLEAQPIYTETQERQPLQANWSQQSLPCEGNASDGCRKAGKSIKFQQEIKVHSVATCCGENNYVAAARNSDGLDATSAAESRLHEVPLKFFQELSLETDKWGNVSFQELMALADAAGTAKAAEEASKITGLNAENMSCCIQFTQLPEISTSSSLENQGLDSSSQNNPKTPHCENVISSRLCFDLNSPPRTIADASTTLVSSQFEPVTPDPTRRTDGRKVSNSAAAAKETRMQNEVMMTPELHELQNNQSVLVENQSWATISTVIGENFKPEVGSEQQTDLTKTPLQKPRRRKHRPKVVVEGQPNTKRNRNRGTPKPTGHQEIAKPKRKYVRKSTVGKPVDSPLEGKTNGTDLEATPKRKYVRRSAVGKPVDTPLEGKTDGTDLEAKPSSSENVPKSKRKYVRRKGVEQSTTPLEVGCTTRNDTMPVRVTRSSCKKSLNFNSEGRGPDERSTQPPLDVDAKSHSQASIPEDQSRSTMKLGQEMEVAQPPLDADAKSHSQASIPEDQSRSTMKLGQGMEVTVEKTEVGVAYDLTQTIDRAFQGYLFVNESQPSGDTTYCTSNQNGCTRGKCQIVFSDVTHDKEASNFGTLSSDARCVTGSTSSCSSSACLTQETQSRKSKSQRSFRSDESESRRINATRAHYNLLQACQELFPPYGYNCQGTPSMQFPTIFKKKRTENSHKSATSSILQKSSTYDNDGRDSLRPSNDYQIYNFTSGTDFMMSAAHSDANSIPTAAAAADGTRHEQNPFVCLPILRSAERLTKKRSKGPIRVRDFASLHEIWGQFPTSSRGMLSSGVLKGPHTCMDALVADNRPRMTTKKRSKRNSVASNSSFSNTYDHQKFAKMSMGSSTKLWKNKSSTIDAIIEQFNYLDIQKEHNGLFNQEQNALVTYQVDCPWQNSIVLYQSNGSVVPYDGLSSQIRKRRPRPKVDLDEETNRVWKLLLEDINNDGIDGTDQQKAQWWAGERAVFRGRADSFIARMHLVQGDRRFTPWKGSVVDSVVGVFLTQNVSDHLSSSAFISMAARFPLKSKSNHYHTQPCEQQTTEGQVIIDPDDTIKWHKKVSSQLACLQDSVTLCDKECNEEVTITRDSSGDTSEGTTKATKILRSISSDSSECSPKLYNEPDISSLKSQDDQRLASFNGDSRELDVISSQNSVISSHSSVETINKAESYSQSSSEAEPADGTCGSFVKLLQMAGTTMLHGVYNEGSRKRSSSLGMPTKSEGFGELRNFDLSEDNRFCDAYKENELFVTEQIGSAESSAGVPCQNTIAISFEELQKFSIENSDSNSPNNHQRPIEDQETELVSEVQKQENNCRVGQVSNPLSSSECILDVSGKTQITRNQKAVHLNLNDCNTIVEKIDEVSPSISNAKRGRNGKEKKDAIDWDSLRIQALSNGEKRERTANTMDSVDWEAVRCAEVEDIAETIKERGMNNMLARRIQDFLNRLVTDHGSIDLEWLRDVPPDRVKDYLLSVKGLGLKSVECVRLLTLHHLAFPVDTNVGRIAVRLGWVPLQPLPESLQLHLLELYPVLESIQKFLWPRLCKLDQRTLYELHYQMITFGKVFCTKSKPNCNSCPMRGECRHFASAFASARLALPAPEDKSIITAAQYRDPNTNPEENINHLQLPLPQTSQQLESGSQVGTCGPIIEEPATPEPIIIEEPATPEPIIEQPASPQLEHTQIPELDIEDAFHEDEDADEIPTIKLNIEELNQNLLNYIQKNVVLTSESEMSKALVVLTPEAASIPTTKLKNISRLRTEHYVYELPDAHPLLKGFDQREPDDPSSYLLAIWTPGETIDSIQPPERSCSFQESGKLCDRETCFSCNSIREANSQTVRGTLLIPCRTAMRGSFPLNGTYFQVNEVFADHESSLNPIDVPRNWLWNLRRRTVYFGTSIPTIFKGLSQEEIQYCFWRGFVCLRGFDRKTRAPRPLVARLHFPASKLTKKRGRTDES
nr:protein ROS1-like isoform X2 [Coffea arabica]